ncbi:hypothetical protein FRC14_005130 [Serendipita sp. 396]|nr:hypothetical protein FRC14_005130 [Serendipita sp. 396]
MEIWNDPPIIEGDPITSSSTLIGGSGGGGPDQREEERLAGMMRKLSGRWKKSSKQSTLAAAAQVPFDSSPDHDLHQTRLEYSLQSLKLYNGGPVVNADTPR